MLSTFWCIRPANWDNHAWQLPIPSFFYLLPVGGYAALAVRLSHLGQNFNVVGLRLSQAKPRNASSMVVD
jgi:hypothetical protein